MQGENTVQYVDVMDRIGNRLDAAYTLDRWVKCHSHRKGQRQGSNVCSRRITDYAAYGLVAA